MTDITRFKAIFSGLDIAYGTYKIEKSRGDGKQAGKAVVVRQPPTDDLWAKHLEGVEPSLGIIPIRADNTCTWGAIDIDQYPLDHKGLVDKLRKLELPLIVCRSKSGGAHCFLFTKEPVTAYDMQTYLKGAAALLGESGREIFPKQAEILVERGDTGNFLNLPYFAGDNGMRYAFKDDGAAATLEEFYALFDQYSVDGIPDLPDAPKVGETPIPDGPPCLQSLCAQGFPEGTRNNGLFNIGIYLKKVHPVGWEDKLMEHNFKYFHPPLGMSEVNLLVKQLSKKEYLYKCKDAPINSFCNAGLCRTRRHGIGTAGPDAPTITSLSKYNSDPPLWFLDVNGRRIELDTDSLHNQHLFQKACVERLNLLPPSVKKNDWEGLLNGLLREMVELEKIHEASDDISVVGRFYELLEEYCTHLQQAMDRDELLLGRPWTNEEEAKTYFRLKDFELHLKRSNFYGMTAPQMAARLRDIGGEPISLFIKNRTVRCWRVPSFKKQDSPFVTPVQQLGSPF